MIEGFFEWSFSRYQTEFKTSIRGSDFIFNCVRFLHYNCHKISFKHIRSYKDSPDWIKNKKATTNWINKNDNKCLQINAAPVATNNGEIKIDPQRMSKIKAFISK